MALVRELGPTLIALEDTVFVTCAALISTAGSTTPQGPQNLNATADAIAQGSAETTAFGIIIDRLGPLVGARYQVAMPSATFHASRGSTETDRKITLGVRIQHGDSSGGGDMAEYSTQNASQKTFFGTGRTSDMQNWDTGYSTGAVFLQTKPAYYDMRAAKRYVRVAIPVFKDKVTTESSGDEHARVGAHITFLAGDRLPEVLSNVYGTATAT